MEVVVTSSKDLRAIVREELERIHLKRPDRRTSGARAAEAKLDIGWLSNEEAQKAMGLSRATLARYRADGTLPYSKLGQNIFYKTDDIKAALQGRSEERRVGTEDGLERKAEHRANNNTMRTLAL